MTEAQKLIRLDLRAMTPAEYLKRHSREDLNEQAREFGIVDEDVAGFSNKQQVYDAIVAVAKLPDPALRGFSKVKKPVARMWVHCDTAFAEAREEQGVAPREKFEKPRRKDVIASAVEAGIAYHTARTQYQVWFQYTQSGTYLLRDGNLDDLPRSVAEILNPEPEAEEAEQDA